MATGTVKVVTDKGYGFIKTQDSEKDVFFHESNLTGDLATRKLRVGDEIEFDIENTQRGTNAVNIKLAGGSEESAEETEVSAEGEEVSTDEVSEDDSATDEVVEDEEVAEDPVAA